MLVSVFEQFLSSIALDNRHLCCCKKYISTSFRLIALNKIRSSYNKWCFLLLKLSEIYKLLEELVVTLITS